MVPVIFVPFNLYSRNIATIVNLKKNYWESENKKVKLHIANW